MPIRWSALKASEAANRIEEALEKAVEPLQEAETVAREAIKLPNLPQYIESDFSRVIGEISDCLGGTQFHPKGWFKTTIERIRKDIPSDALKDERENVKNGRTPALM